MNSNHPYWESADRPGAQTRWTGPQRAMYLGLLLGLIACGALHLQTLFWLFGLAVFVLYGSVICVRVLAVMAGLLGRHSIHVDDPWAMADADLPVYTLLLPVYHEAAVLPQLVAAIEALDYPSSKLDVKLLIEADDHETARAVERLDSPSYVETIVVPDGGPKTKPRACNVGLARARGEFVVVFDAEDRPEPDQLRKAVAAFARMGPNVVCLQAHLNYYNSRRNLLTRWFTIEYTAWFDLYLPGLHALRAPIPLGGTSNHFRIDALRALHGWDPYNVAEDCDLGIRIERAGGRTRILDSTTWEEAVDRVGPWVRQRSRWMKGYWQTHLCHTRDPGAGLRQLGPLKWLMMIVVVGGQVMSLLVNPICWVIAGLWIVYRWPLYSVYAPATAGLLVGSVTFALFNIFFVIVHVIGIVRRRRYDLLPLALLMPIYWIMVSLGAWRGVFQFFTFPFKWEKTPHLGEAHREAPPDSSAASAAHAGRGWISATLLLAVVLAIGYAAWDTPRQLDLPRRFRFAAIRMDGHTQEHEVEIDDSWFGRKTLRLEILPTWAPREDARRVDVARLRVFLKVGDGDWFESIVDGIEATGKQARLTVNLPLQEGWSAVEANLPWGPWCLRRIRAVGAQVYGEPGRIESVRIVEAAAVGKATRAPLQTRVLSAPMQIEQYEPATIRFSPGRIYANPFDPEQFDAWGVFTDPDGATHRVPAFYARDYTRTLQQAAEHLQPFGQPYWAVRYCPRKAGTYQWHLEGRDAMGDSFQTDVQPLRVSASSRKGFVRASHGGRHFEFDNGDFFYPIALNIRSPDDDKIPNLGVIKQPLKKRGTYIMDDFLARMQAARITMGRMWLMPSWCGLEWRRDWPGYHGIGVYSLKNAWRIEYMLDDAQSRGVSLELALDSHGPYTSAYDSKWKLNPFNVRNGGPLQEPADVFSDPTMMKAFRNRYRYLAARFGAHPALFGWTLWIEANVVNPDIAILRDWHQEMAGYLSELDSGDHLISTEFTTATGEPEVWKLPGITYVQAPQYNWGNGMPDTWARIARQISRYGKPAIIEEFGGFSDGGDMRWIAHELHDGPWLGWTLPLAATPMPWWWNLTFGEDLARHQARFVRFIEDVDLRDVPWQFRRLRVVSGDRKLRARARHSATRAYLWIYGPASDVHYRKRTHHDGHQRSLEAYLARAGAFRALDEDPGAQFDEITYARVDLRPLRLEQGTYRVEFWDTWTDTPPMHKTLTVSADPPFLPLPPITRDVAVKLVRQP